MALSPYDVTVPFHAYVNEIPSYMTDLVAWRPPQHVLDVMGLFGVVVLIYWLAWLVNKPRRVVVVGDDSMARHFRSAKLNYLVGEIITNGIEEAVFKERMSRDESIEVYTKIGREFGLVDLLPKYYGNPRPKNRKLTRNETENLKEKIRERIKKQTVDNVVELPKKKVGEFLKRA